MDISEAICRLQARLLSGLSIPSEILELSHFVSS
jgi:hypothetical protein